MVRQVFLSNVDTSSTVHSSSPFRRSKNILHRLTIYPCKQILNASEVDATQAVACFFPGKKETTTRGITIFHIDANGRRRYIYTIQRFFRAFARAFFSAETYMYVYAYVFRPVQFRTRKSSSITSPCAKSRSLTDIGCRPLMLKNREMRKHASVSRIICLFLYIHIPV